ncbi:hypothetical protein E0W60_36395 (plasmid) [Cupriavidus oxalaticus]|uniref:Transposase n=1 Tax=Cupriavidus oxalaticus TaxID=96344 RepID=A0A4P7LJN0_9BURK|nr:hypothetical protein E0W60_36395 [Cupriavidus oxalaticus]
MLKPCQSAPEERSPHFGALSHSGIRYVSPAQRHAGQDDKILAARHALYVRAREHNPRRWSCNTRDWSPIETVTLNPEREIAVPTGIKPGAENQRLAA